MIRATDSRSGTDLSCVSTVFDCIQWLHLHHLALGAPDEVMAPSRLAYQPKNLWIWCGKIRGLYCSFSALA